MHLDGTRLRNGQVTNRRPSKLLEAKLEHVLKLTPHLTDKTNVGARVAVRIRMNCGESRWPLSSKLATLIGIYCLTSAFGLVGIALGDASTSDGPLEGDRGVDKAGYSLLNPTPRDLLRDMEALYEGPYTVDAGHFQVEMYLFGYTRDQESAGDSELRSDFWAAAPVTIKLGLLNTVDVQLFTVPYSSLRVENQRSGAVTRQQGFGDLTARLKWNLWGNDAGSTALALTPYVRFPTSSDDLGTDAPEGGIIVPIAVELPKGFWLGFAPEFGWLRDGHARGYHLDFASRNYLWHELVGRLSGYIEFDPQVDTEHPEDWAGVLGVGFSYRATPNLQFDTGIMFGVTRPAADINVFLGTSYRF